MQNTSSDINRSVGEIVADDYRTAKVFEKYGVDYCCGGKTTLSDICLEQGIDRAEIVREIEAVKNTPIERSQNYAAWTNSFLADYIINTHHTYLKENLDQIAAYTTKIAQVHGEKHPEVREIAALFAKIVTLFAKIVTDLSAHLREEEEVCFPAIKRVEEAKKLGKSPSVEDIETIARTLEKFDVEHNEVGEAAHKIRRLAKDYALPDDACNTFMITYQKLKEFEEDLHKHVHLENNVLFPKVSVI